MHADLAIVLLCLAVAIAMFAANRPRMDAVDVNNSRLSATGAVQTLVVVAQQALAARTGRHDFSREHAVDLGDGMLPPNVELPFTTAEAEFLIGLQLRRALLAIVFASQEREDLGVLRTERRRGRRQPAYQEMADYSFMQYFCAFVLPYQRDRLGTVTSREELLAANDLHAIAAPHRHPRRGHPPR